MTVSFMDVRGLFPGNNLRDGLLMWQQGITGRLLVSRLPFPNAGTYRVVTFHYRFLVTL